MAEERSADRLAKAIMTPGVLDELKARPEATLEKLTEQAKSLPAYVQDRTIYRMVVGALGVVIIIVVIGALMLALRAPAGTQVQIPDVLTALGSAAIGALAGILAPAPNRGQ